MRFDRPLSRRGALAGALLVAGASSARTQNVTDLPKPLAVSMVMPGNVSYRAKLFRPLRTPAPSIVLVHDGWGPLPEFDSMGAALAFEGIMGLVVDLAGGKIASDPLGAERLAKEVDGQEPGEAVAYWYDWMRNRLEGDQRIGAFGFGPGGRWAVDGSLRKSAHGVAVWCTRIANPPSDLASIYETFIGHFSDRDVVPGPVYVAELAQRLIDAHREGHFFRYDSKPQFYNPRSPDYDKAAALLAWRRTITIYRKIWRLPPAT